MQVQRVIAHAAPTPRRKPATGARVWLSRETMSVWGWLGIGLLLRMSTFGRFPLREDEALYGYWARLIASGQDTMLERVAVDKPPFFIYTLARFFEEFGAFAATGRALGVLCSVLSLGLLFWLARRLYGFPTARLALALFALSPFAISFAPTMYTDPMLVMWLLLALLCAAYRFGLGAGLALGMAFATKQNALLFAPLILGALLIGPQSVKRKTYSVLFASAAFYFVWFKVWQWDGWRILPAEIPSFWQQSWNSYGGLAFISPAAWPARLAEWWQVWRWLGGWTGGSLVLLTLAVLGITQHATRNTQYEIRWTRLLAAFVLAYAALHVVFSFQAWDRYMLGLAPLLALLAGRGTLVGWQWLVERRHLRLALATTALAAILWGAGVAASAKIPVGGDHGAYAGIETTARYLQSAVPETRGVLYQRWLGWHWSWYLWDGPHGRVYWSNPAMLVDDLRADPAGYTRFVVFPGWHTDERPALETALAAVELRLAERLRVRAGARTQFVVFEIVAEGEG